MGELSFVMAHKVNGVSVLHTDLMKTTVFEDLNRLHPDRIVAQTNGVTPRRWLLSCNPRLARSSPTGSARTGSAIWSSLSKLEAHVDDAPFLAAYAEAKRANKADLAAWVAAEHGLTSTPT
jgi:starch phosphorylase